MLHSKPIPSSPKDKFLPVRPFGLYVKVNSGQVKGSEKTRDDGVLCVEPREIHYKGVVEGFVACRTWASSPIEFSLPEPDEDGFFMVGSTLYVFTNVGFPSPWHPMENGKFYYLNKKEVMQRVLMNMFGSKDYMIPGEVGENVLSGVFSHFFFNSSPTVTAHVNNEKLQTVLLSRLVTHPFVRQVQNSDVQIEGSRYLVTLFPRKDGLNIEPYLYNPKTMRKRLDPCSTSVSETINSVYQLADGAVIEGGQIKEGVSDFCEFTRKNSIFVKMTPKRAYLGRAAVMNSAMLTNPENRVVITEGSKVHTRNLVTAIMDLGLATFEDTIAMSETCAKDFEAQVLTKITRWTPDSFQNLKVKIGDIVNPGQILAIRPMDSVIEPGIDEESEDVTGVEVDSENKQIAISAVELREPAVLERIEETPSWHSTQRGVRTTWIFRSFIPMRTGDKITCFAGCKGVVKILPDNEMPKRANGKPVDICVSRFSVSRRSTISMILEMALGRAFESGKTSRIVAMGDELPVDFRWANMHEGSKESLFYKGEKLPEQTYVGPMAWMRILKSGIASRRASSVGTNRPLTGEGLLPDMARSAGQSLDPSKSIVLVSRGMYKTLMTILGDSPGIEAMLDTVSAIETPAEETK